MNFDIGDIVGTGLSPIGYGPFAGAKYAMGRGQGQSGMDYSGMADARNADIEAGYKKGRELFYDDPDMQMLRQKRMDLSQGYNSPELGAFREQARGELAGEGANAIRRQAGQQARAGIGGARAAAGQAATASSLQGKRAEMERKMAMDQSQMVRQGTNDLQSFLMRQRFGELSTGLGQAQLGVADRGAQMQADIAGRQQPQGIFGTMMNTVFG